jgi:membrane protein required for colicin V production
MNLLDIILILIVGGSVAAGFMAGFARAAIGFLAVIVGIGIGFWFYGIPAAWLHSFIQNETIANVLGFILVFFKWTGLSGLDRILGAGFGLVRGTLAAVAFIAVLMAFTPKPPPNWMVGSTVLPYAIDASNLCAALAPNAMKEAFATMMAEVRQSWDEQVKKARDYREKVVPKKAK